MAEKYNVHEIVASIQGEAAHFGVFTNFLRFSGCNLACSFCDTKEHVNGMEMTLEEILAVLDKMPAPWVHLCGGEPALQADHELVEALQDRGFQVSMETNGTLPITVQVDYLVVSPKVTPATLRTNFRGRVVDELKYVLRAGQEPPIPMPIPALAYLVSPVFKGDAADPAAVGWVMGLVAKWPNLLRFSIQVHKFLGVK
jgi:organic radical activating enzyme